MLLRGAAHDGAQSGRVAVLDALRPRGRSVPRRVALIAPLLTLSLGAPSAMTAVTDTTPPSGTASFHDVHVADETLEFRLAFSDPESGLVSIVLSCDDGPTATYPYSTQLIFKGMDPTAGGCTTFGPHAFTVGVVNGAGLTTAVPVSASTEPTVRFEYPLPPRTGERFTIRPVYSGGFTPPSDAHCRWEFRWGSTTALRDNEFDETFGGMLFEGPASKGFCGEWTFTLPWVPVPQFEVNFNGPASSIRSGEWPDRELIHATVAGTDRRIRESNLPIAQVLPSTYTPIVGQPVTYTRYLIGGADGCCQPRWFARLGSGEAPIVWEKWTTSSTFTITPPKPGPLFVGWDREKPNDLLTAYYDPPVRYADTSPPNTTAPIQKFAFGGTGQTVPVWITWSGTDKGWGIKAYRLQRSVNGGAWTNVTLPTARTTSIKAQLAYGTTYRYRVRATDKASNIGSWDYGPAFRPRRFADTSAAVRYSSGWEAVTDPTAFGGVIHESRTGDRSARFTFTGRDIAWIAERGPTFGKARVYVDGVYITTVDTRLDQVLPRRLVFRRHWSSVGTHTIRIVVSGTAGRPTISLDGFAILR